MDNEKKVTEHFNAGIVAINPDDVKTAYEKGAEKIKEIGKKIPDALIKMWQDLKTMIALLDDYISGIYKEVPWHVIAAISVAVLYFSNPIDIIPDFIPLLGYLDDALMVKLALDIAGNDLRSYRKWQEEQAMETEKI